MTTPRKPSPSRGTEKESASFNLDYQHLLRLFVKHWYWLAGGCILGIVISIFYAMSQQSIYAATATLYVPERAAAPTIDSGVDLSDLKTYEQLLQTKALPDSVVKDDKLYENPAFLPEGCPIPVDEDSAVGMLWGSISVHVRPLTRLIDITVEHRDPEMAQKLANAVANAAIEQQANLTSSVGGNIGDTLEKDITRLRAQLADAEVRLKDYERKKGIVSSGDAGGIDQQEQHLRDVQQQLQTAETQVELLEERYGDEHPKLIQAKQLVKQLTDEVNKAKAEDDATGDSDSQYSGLKADVESLRFQLESTLKEYQAAQQQANVSFSTMRISDEATRPFVPVRPAKKKIVLTGGFLGLLAGAGVVVVLYFLDSSIRTVSQAENTLGLPVIAAVPILAESDSKSSLPTFSDPQSFVAESFRGLRASLILQDRQTPLKTILVGSAIPGEGKSFCAANLAVAFAQAGHKTLLIDADLRLPTAHKYFNLNQDSSGFVDILSGRATLEDSIVHSQIATLDLLLATIPADAPAELLSNNRLPQLLDEVAQRYDRIVIDSAPLNAVSDTMLILPKADAILLVVRASQTPASETKGALLKISSSKMKPLGLILNYLAPHTLKAYSYGYSYGQKPPKEKSGR